jgi:hypothetical protein
MKIISADTSIATSEGDGTAISDLHWPSEDSLVDKEDSMADAAAAAVVVPPESNTLTSSCNSRNNSNSAPDCRDETKQCKLEAKSEDDGTIHPAVTTDSKPAMQWYRQAATAVRAAFKTTAVQTAFRNTTLVTHWSLYSVMVLVLILWFTVSVVPNPLKHARHGDTTVSASFIEELATAVATKLHVPNENTAMGRLDVDVAAAAAVAPTTPTFQSFPFPILLSTPELCTVTADTIGDKGDPSIVLTQSNGKDDDDASNRWSVSYRGDLDWKGKLPSGVTEPSHWIQLDFVEPVLLTRVVLDWETCYSDHYDLQIRTSKLSPWKTIVQSKDYPIVIHSWGEGGTSSSVPGVALHNEDDVSIPAFAFASGLATSLRVFVHDTAHKNGCLSLWHIQVMGYNSVNQERPLVRTELTGPSPSSTGAGAAADFTMTASPNFIPPAAAAAAAAAAEQAVAAASTCSWFGLPWSSRSSSRSCRHTIVDTFNQQHWHVRSQSDFGGGAWLRLDFSTDVFVTKVILDWSVGFAAQYTVAVGSDLDGWHTIGHFDMDRSRGRDNHPANDKSSPSSGRRSNGTFTVETTGKLPELVGTGVFLHQYTHTLHEPLAQHAPTRHVRIWIHKLANVVSPTTKAKSKSAALSLWKVRVFGYKV